MRVAEVCDSQGGISIPKHLELELVLSQLRVFSSGEGGA